MTTDPEPEDKPAALPTFEETVAFHGHACPGLAIGYRAAIAAMNRLAVSPSEDEDLVAIVENDACGVDAVQWICGCTFGKGNLVFRDYGKHAFTLYNRTKGQGVRVYVEPPEQAPDAAESDRAARIAWLLSLPDEQLLHIGEAREPQPSKARIHASSRCARCGERMMETRSRMVADKPMCIACAEE